MKSLYLATVLLVALAGCMPADVTDSDASKRISERRLAAEEVVARAEAGGAVTVEELATVKDTLVAIRKENAKLRDELAENEEDLARQERIIKAGKGVADDLGGPIGLVVTALATGITTFIAAKKSAAKPVEDQKRELKETDDYADDLAARIDKLEGRLSERARLEAVVPTGIGAPHTWVQGSTGVQPIT